MNNLLTMRYIKSLLVILLITSIVYSCNKENEEPNDYFYNKISESLYPLLFNQGSYWIYNNTDNFLIDSVVLSKFIIDTIVIGPGGPGQGPAGEEQYYNLTYNSSQFGEYMEQLVGYVISHGCIYGGYIYLSSHKIGDKSLNAEITEIYDSLIVNEKSYSNVVKMELNKDEYLSTDMNLYYVDSIGIIKKEIKENNSVIETWDLLRYNVTLYEIN